MIDEMLDAARSAGPNTRLAVEFLSEIASGGRIAMTAIVPDGPIYGRTFSLPNETSALADWIGAWQGKGNVHFGLNEPVAVERQTGRNGRIAVADVERLRGVVLDMDPRRDAEATPGGLALERVRLRAQAEFLLRNCIAEPAAVIDSGAGFQVIWRFPEALPATAENVVQTVEQSRGLAHAFGGDHTHDVAHLFRVPFTINLPNEAKRKRGRTPTVSSLVAMDSRAKVRLEALRHLAEPAARGPAESGSAPAFDIGDEAEGVVGAPEDLSAPLKAKISAAVEGSAVLRNALDAEWAAERFQDRSSRDFALAAALREAGCFTEPEAACVLAAYGSDKISDRGLDYLAATLQRAWASTVPRATANDYFDAEAAAAAATSAQAEPDAIDWIEPAVWQGVEPPPREWEVNGLIPRREVTLLYGEGGVGKTLLALQYATAAATGQRFLGQSTRPARVLCFFCEDSADELHRRQNDINRLFGIQHVDLANLRISPRRGEDNFLAVFGRDGLMRLRPVWHRLKRDALAFGADVVIIDTLADVFPGSEIDRAQVSAFVKGCLGKLADEIQGSVIALGHPSQSGKQSGAGTSGSTAWSNAARSRLYLRYPEGADGGNIRELQGMKANYGPKGNTFKLRWARGAFEGLMASIAADSSKASLLPQSTDAAEAAVISVLMQHPGERMGLAKNSVYFAPSVLLKLEPDDLSAFGKTEILGALERLMRRGAVREENIGYSESKHPIRGLVIVADKLSAQMPDETATPAPQSEGEAPQSGPGHFAENGLTH